MNPGDLLRTRCRTSLWKEPGHGSKMLTYVEKACALVLLARKPGAWDIRVNDGGNRWDGSDKRTVEQFLVLDAVSMRVGWIYEDSCEAL